MLPVIILFSLFSDNGDVRAKPCVGNLGQCTVGFHGEQLIPNSISKLLIALAESNAVVFGSEFFAVGARYTSTPTDILLSFSYLVVFAAVMYLLARQAFLRAVVT